MINTIVDISEIEFVQSEVENDLVESIRTRGIAIPVRVNRKDKQYICVDGNKRLSASALLVNENDKFRRIPVMLMNDFSKSGSGFWGNTQNHH